MGLNNFGDKTKTYLSKIKTSEPARRFGNLLGYSSSPSSSNSVTKMNTTNTKGKKQINDQDNDEAYASKFECNICLEPAKDAVISMCGHLFCWPCLHQWFETRPHNTVCPVCKDQISRDKVIPLYGRDNSESSGTTKDPRNKKYPPRPSGQRSSNTETPQNNSANFDFFANGNNSFFGPSLSTSLNSMFGGPGIHMAFGIGAFPFGFFTTMFNLGSVLPNTPPNHATSTNGETQGQPNGENWEENSSTQSPFTDPNYAANDQFLSKMFLWVAILLIFWLLLA